MKLYPIITLFLLLFSCSDNSNRSIASNWNCNQLIKFFSQAIKKNELTPRIYFIMPRINGNGTLDDITNQLDDYQAMGVKQLWVGPIHPQVSHDPIHGINNHGYWTLNHSIVDPALGGQAAFNRLMREANKNNIEIILDTPLNHFGYGKTFKIGDKEVFVTDERYFRIFDNDSESNMWKLYGILDNSTDTTQILDAQKQISKLPLSGLPSLNHQNREVIDYLINSYKGFIDQGITQFRIDAVKHISFDFLSEFMNSLTVHGKNKGKQVEFLLELLVHGDKQMDVLAAELIRLTDKSVRMKFIDFPHAANLRGIAYPGYNFNTLDNFVRMRQTSKVPSSRYVPFLENHDLEKPLPNVYTRRMAYGISEFVSENQTILYHGHEGISSGEEFARKIIKGVDPDGEIAVILRKVREFANGHSLTVEKAHEDFVVISRITDNKKVYFAANKTGETDFIFQGEAGIKYRIAYSDGNASINGQTITIKPQSFAVIAPIL